MGGRGGAMVALIPFECPKCERPYRVELDFAKMRRLNRVAICGGCDGRFSLNVRLERSSRPTEPDPFAEEREQAAARRDSGFHRPGRDERPNRPIVPTGEAVLIVGPPPPAPSTPPMESGLEEESPPSGPRLRSPKTRRQTNLPTESAPDEVERHDTEPDMPAFVVEVGTPGAPNGRKTTKSYRPEHLVTKPGLGVPKGETASR